MDSTVSKLFEVETPSSSGSHSGIQARDNSRVFFGGNVTVKNSFRNSERKKPPIPLRNYPVCSKFFYGREDVLRQVKESIILCEKAETSLQRIVAIIGLGGMGKSEIAKVLAKELQSKYEYIFWFDAQTKISLESDLQHLASILKIPWNSNESSLKSVLCDVYQSLAQNYKNGILIFDNAEVLKAEQGNFALEKYLLPDFHCKKPVFLVTSRNPMNSECDDVKCVRLNQLSDEESVQCMLRILRIENHPLTSSLEKGITSLVNMSEGHPLGLTLIGQSLYEEVKDILWDETKIEPEVMSYIEDLKDSGLKDIPGKSNYEDNVQKITDLTIEKLLKTRKGKIAVELLNIVALLSPDDIHAGLINGIYCEKPFETHKVLCPKFVWEDLETTVRAGLKLLLSSSLLKIESKAYEKYGYQYKYDMIKIHRLIQQSAQKRLLRLNSTMEPLEKILRFNKRSHLNEDHVDFLLQFFLRNKLAYLHPETCSLQILGMQLQQNTSWGALKRDGVKLLDQVRDVVRTKKEEFHPDCSKALCLFEMCVHENRKTFSEDHWDQLKRSIEELSPQFSKQRWLLRLVMLIVDEMHDRLTCLPRVAQRWADVVDWVVKHYIDGNEDSRRELNITRFVERHGWYRNKIGMLDWGAEREFLSKLFDCASECGTSHVFWGGLLVIKVESERDRFWADLVGMMRKMVECLSSVMAALPIFYDKQREPKALAQCLLTFPGTNAFSRSLQFSQDSFKYWFIINNWNFHKCVRKVVYYAELRDSLTSTEGFVSSLWDLTEFGFKKLSSSWEYMNKVRDTTCFEGITRGLAHLLGTWWNFFVYDVDLYQNFGEKLDSEVEDLLERPWDRKSIYKLSSQFLIWQANAEYFAGGEPCSPRTRNWIQKLLEYKKQWEEARASSLH